MQSVFLQAVFLNANRYINKSFQLFIYDGRLQSNIMLLSPLKRSLPAPSDELLKRRPVDYGCDEGN
jgi:hypothetical protein